MGFESDAAHLPSVARCPATTTHLFSMRGSVFSHALMRVNDDIDIHRALDRGADDFDAVTHCR